MVYLGPSRGCISCKQRRKKCDEERPSCQRCQRAGRACGGYEDTRHAAFRGYEPPSESVLPDASAQPPVSSARRCTLPPRNPDPVADERRLPVDDYPVEVTSAQSHDYALRAFFYDFCVTSPNLVLSGGYLSHVEFIVRRLGPTSDLAQACEMVASATHSQALNRPAMMERADGFYQQLLGSLAKSIHNVDQSKEATNSRLMALLLGIHQIAMAHESDYCSHEAHARGLAAMLGVAPEPANLIDRILSAPASGGTSRDFTSLYIGVDSLIQKFDASQNDSSIDVRTAREEGITLSHRFAQWEASRPIEMRPTQVGHVDGPAVNDKRTLLNDDFPVGLWPGRVDTYLDLSIAGIWTIFRTSWLRLIAAIVSNLSTASLQDQGTDMIVLQATGRRLFGDVAASLPYHLTDNLPEFLGDLAKSRTIATPGRKLGGCLLLHCLYDLSTMECLDECRRLYVRKCLAWIGAEMGIGLANVMASNSDLDDQYVNSSRFIIWAGFLQHK